MLERRYWEEEKKNRCRLCGGKEETWEHIWEECGEWKEGGEVWQEAVKWVLGEEGEGEGWMRELERKRGGNRGEGKEKGAKGGREKEGNKNENKK